MPKASREQKKKELPRLYPRTEEILIFSDMGELDHVFELLDNCKKNVNSTGSDVTCDEWCELLNYSVIYHLMHVLRKACFEFERFWMEGENWKLEDDKQFMDYMNDPDELQWLVTDLDFGRVKTVADGEYVRYAYEPTYHAAARSLQMAMYTYKYPGDKDWIDYCLKELRQILTRYHAAALEIAMHRDNVYLNSNARNIEVGKKRSIQVREWARKGGKEVEKYSENEKINWIKVARELQLKNPSIKSSRGLAKKVIETMEMDDSSYESVRKHLLKNGFKLFG